MQTLTRLEIPMRPGGEGVVVAPVANNGWARYFYPDDGRSHPLLRFLMRWNGREFETPRAWFDFYLVEDRARAIRDAPIGRIKAAINQPRIRSALKPLVNSVNDEWLHSVHFPVDVGQWWLHPIEAEAERLNLQLSIPKASGRKPDDFYMQVLDRYSYLEAVSIRAANELAEANGVPVTTVHGWVKEARRRGVGV